MIEITYKCSAVMREDFLVRGIGKRAIHIALPYDANSSKPISEILTEFELYWLLESVTKQVQKKFKWKHIVINLPYLSETKYQKDITSIYVNNCCGYKYKIGVFGEVVDTDHFLNDSYYSPKGFYILKNKENTK